MNSTGYRLLAAFCMVLFACGRLAPASAATEWQTLLTEEFGSKEVSFYTGQASEAYYGVDDDGRYVIDGLNTSIDSLSALTKNLYYYYAEAECELLDTRIGDMAFCGLVFHYNKKIPGKLAYYVFYIYGDGYYGAKRVIGDNAEVILPLTKSDYIDSGRPNVLAVDARGTRFDLYINGRYVDGFTDVRIDGGGFGFYVSQQARAAFDNFKVKVERRGGGPGEVESPELVEGSSDDAPAHSNVSRGDSFNGYSFPDIPKDPNRPVYPWEVGVDKSEKARKNRARENEEEDLADKRLKEGRADPQEDKAPPQEEPKSAPAEKEKPAEPPQQDPPQQADPPREDPPQKDESSSQAAADDYHAPEPGMAPPAAADEQPAHKDEVQAAEEKQPDNAPLPEAQPAAEQPARDETEPLETHWYDKPELSGPPEGSADEQKPPASEAARPAEPQAAPAEPPKQPATADPGQPVTADVPQEAAQPPEAKGDDTYINVSLPEQQAPAEAEAQPADTQSAEDGKGSDPKPDERDKDKPDPEEIMKRVRASTTGSDDWSTTAPPYHPPAEEKPAEPARDKAEDKPAENRDGGSDVNAGEMKGIELPPLDLDKAQDRDQSGDNKQPAAGDTAAAGEPAPADSQTAPAESETQTAPAEPEQDTAPAQNSDGGLSLFPKAGNADAGGEPEPESSADDADERARASDRPSPQPPIEKPQAETAQNSREAGELLPSDAGTPANSASKDYDPFEGNPAVQTVYDDFTEQRWPVADGDTSSYRYFGAAYEIDNTKSDTMAISYQQGSFTDARYGVDVEYLGGLDYVGYGIAARFTVKNGNVSYYGMFVSQSGEFLLLKVLDGKEYVLRDWSSVPNLSRTLSNRIGIEMIGSSIQCSVNGEVVASVTDDSLTGGGYALLCGPGTSTRFDNLTIKGLTAAGN